jgi:hypothetical protein
VPGPQGPPSAGRTPRGPSFGTLRPRGPVLWWLTGCAVTAVILGFGAALGLWFLPFVAGIAAGAAPWRARSALAGLPPHAAVGVAATLLAGLLQALAALWLARALTYRLR